MGLSGHSDIGGMASNTNVTMTSAGGVMIQTVMTEFGSGVRTYTARSWQRNFAYRWTGCG